MKRLIQVLHLITFFKVADREEHLTIKQPSMMAKTLAIFINQGGLQEGLKEMCLLSNRETGQTSFQSELANAEFDRHCNVSYAQWGSELVVKAKSNLRPSRTTPTELFGNYGYQYWVRYAAQHYQELNHDNFLAKSVLWCLLSERVAGIKLRDSQPRSLEFQRKYEPISKTYNAPTNLHPGDT